MNPPEQLGTPVDSTNLYAGLIHVLVILAIIYMVTSYKTAIKYTEELKAKVEKMIADHKLGVAKKGDDITYVPGVSKDLEDKSEESEEDKLADKEDKVETDKQDLVDVW